VKEIIDECEARDHCILGLLAPSGQSVIPDEEELVFTYGDGEECKVESSTIRNSTMRPSSMGLIFTLDAQATTIQIKSR
jgi:hypothetical protein